MSVQPAGGVIATEDGVTEMEATKTSFAATPDGFVIVKVAPVVVAELAERKAGVIPAAVLEAAARKAICAKRSSYTSTPSTCWRRSSRLRVS
jgi:hypothetical protein